MNAALCTRSLFRPEACSRIEVERDLRARFARDWSATAPGGRRPPFGAARRGPGRAPTAWLRLGGIILALVASGMGASCRRAATDEVRRIPVRVVEVTHASHGETTRYSATVNAQAQVTLTFRSGGYVEHIAQRPSAGGSTRLLEAGDRVKKGELLAAVRQQDYADKVAQAEGVVAQAKAAFDKAAADFTRAKNLLASESITQVQFDAYKAADDANAASLKSAQAALAEAESARGDSSLRAPFDGVVVQRNVDLGALVGPSTPAFVVADTSAVKVVFGVPDTVLGRIELGQAVELHTAPIPEPLTGHVSSIAPAADQRNRLFPVEVLVPNPDDRIKPGFVVTIQIPTQPAVDALTLPLAAVVRPPGAADAFAVFTVEGQETQTVARMRAVTLGDIIGNQIVVREGLKAGERVVAQGAAQLKDGDPVVPVP